MVSFVCPLFPFPWQWNCSSDATGGCWEKRSLPRRGILAALPCWSSEPGKDLHWLSHLGACSLSHPPSPKPGCFMGNGLLGMSCQSFEDKSWALAVDWSLLAAVLDFYFFFPLFSLFSPSWALLGARVACARQCRGHHHCWDLAEVPATPRGICSHSLLEEEVVVQWELPPLWAQELPMGEEVVNSLEGKAAPGFNLFLQGDLCSLL